jgi:hypothetical protein
MVRMRYAKKILIRYGLFCLIGALIGLVLMFRAKSPHVSMVMGSLMLVGFGYAAYCLVCTAQGDLAVLQTSDAEVRITTVFDRYVFPMVNLVSVGVEMVQDDGPPDRSILIRTRERVVNERGWFATQEIVLPTRMMESFDPNALTLAIRAHQLAGQSIRSDAQQIRHRSE